MEAEKLANPAPLGLAGFGMTTVLLNIHNAGFFPLGSMILAMGLCYGGTAQIIAGILEFKKGNTFGMTAFISYGSFWWTLVFILVFKNIPAVPAGFMGWYLFMWGVFTFFMWFGTWGKNRILQYVFLSLTVLFWLLAIGVVILLAIRYSQRDPETNCMGCGELYRPSRSDAPDRFLFHSSGCQKKYTRRSPSTS